MRLYFIIGLILGFLISTVTKTPNEVKKVIAHETTYYQLLNLNVDNGEGVYENVTFVEEVTTRVYANGESLTTEIMYKVKKQ